MMPVRARSWEAEVLAGPRDAGDSRLAGRAGITARPGRGESAPPSDRPCPPVTGSLTRAHTGSDERRPPPARATDARLGSTLRGSRRRLRPLSAAPALPASRASAACAGSPAPPHTWWQAFQAAATRCPPSVCAAEGHRGADLWADEGGPRFHCTQLARVSRGHRGMDTRLPRAQSRQRPAGLFAAGGQGDDLRQGQRDEAACQGSGAHLPSDRDAHACRPLHNNMHDQDP